ncbi:DUF2514 domain-containing protein [Pseudomonas plecoglossicida]|uniref:DUF2514 family protein n=1 Tax=Pseudomonas TaxID=286 RepID=UPI000C241B29|nr:MULTISPECIES: DUF2514 family protein [Pseudomonas]CAB5623559.1 Protein of uncharacterised function (DUF2514) [Pseudomonas putida]MCE0850564.1 DUF2514 domain-containing protein [Pseudomonas asiatica]PJI73864.1 DUF2514 domain-containing protein [Pseudomonas sp. MR 02]PLU99943.1 DUF2514 domain-containing protein [Pseudomonas plecoglossicida]PLV09203.1 DUF2514 domain-containing protein [Pseudomonas plecoglossicida]
MTWLGAVPAWCWWLIAVALVAGGQQYRVAVAEDDTATARGELADYRLEVAERDRRAAAQSRTEEQRRQAVADEEGESARKKLELAQGRAAGAESAADGLRGEIARLRDGHRATCDTIAAQQRQAGASAVVVLGGLLEEADRMAGDLAAALERSRIAGLACEAVVDRMKSTR